ncbi:dicarboxylate/amino acid:cation symporter [Candidatus Accumulibacter phosphatis]|jgi:Na+/H+-dicarboxylate symporter|uniref:Dicarboxylate/amino acid:cation symporter n=1 Tax=Candidatus Accumulibacter phosphatis TaxID=327160 RepID=A0ABX1TZG7_9PROT|nr:dicarboxylate/amino acid:cation symporter [Candidatus Accumulibacter phosphatis]NMQ28835.1 dicarboxylate/amino acid:cation symporter [Candidatus Accumulibacter phosphatis]
MNLTVKVLLGMALGIVVGLVINLGGLSPAGSFVNEYLVDGLFLVVGKLFVNALKMMVVPLVLFSLICGVCGIGDIRLLGRIGTKAFVLYIFTTAIAIATGILLAAGLGIGEGMNAVTETVFTGKDSPPLSEVLINIVPSNPVSAMATGEMLAIIFFAILCGVGMLMVGKKAQPVVEFVELLNEVMMKMVTIIMALAPYAVFCLLAKAIGSLGLDLLVKLMGYVAVLISVLLFHLFVTLQVILKIFSGLSSMTFLKKMRNVQVFAFSTSSSNATIPVTLRTVTERLGVKNSVASFTVPFGATINMDGTAIMQGVATVFIANVYGVDLGFGGYLTVILMSVLASIGTAGVPGVGLIMLSMVFAQVGLPIEGIGLILGVDRLLDMIRTAVNVSGDAVVSVIVAKSEGQLDLDIYNDPDAGAFDTDDVHLDEEVEREMAQMVRNTHDHK